MNKQNQEIYSKIVGSMYIHNVFWIIYENTAPAKYLFVNRPIAFLDELQTTENYEVTYNLDGTVFFEFLS